MFLVLWDAGIFLCSVFVFVFVHFSFGFLASWHTLPRLMWPESLSLEIFWASLILACFPIQVKNRADSAWGQLVCGVSSLKHQKTRGFHSAFPDCHIHTWGHSIWQSLVGEQTVSFLFFRLQKPPQLRGKVFCFLFSLAEHFCDWQGTRSFAYTPELEGSSLGDEKGQWPQLS